MREQLSASTCAPQHVPKYRRTRTDILRPHRLYTYAKFHMNVLGPSEVPLLQKDIIAHYSAAQCGLVDRSRQVHCPIGDSITRPVSARHPEFFSQLLLHMPKLHTAGTASSTSPLYITLPTASIHQRPQYHILGTCSGWRLRLCLEPPSLNSASSLSC